MEGKTKSAILNLFAAVVILLLPHTNLEAKIFANYSEKGFESPGREEIRLHIIKAAGNFMKSYSDFLLFLNKVELAEIEGERIDYNELWQIIDNTIAHMENAKERYDTLKQIADNTPYNQTVISRLLDPNYSLPQESGSSKSVISSEVEIYLRSGDVRGIYHKIHADTRQILDILKVIRSDVEEEAVPGNTYLWTLNRLYSKTMLFGQYTAEIFSKVTGK